MKHLKLPDVLILALILIAGSYVFLGFLSPDPYYLQKGLVAYALLWALRVAVPLLTLALMVLYVLVRTRKLSLALLVMVLTGGLVALALGYPIADSLYQKSYVRQIEKYHPYLQLRPNPLNLESKREDSFVIMTLGGSTTEFADEEKGGWQGRLKSLLPQTINGKKVEILNMGRQWYTTQHVLLNYQLNLRHVKPDVIILMQAVNDLLVNADFSYISHGAFRGDYGHFYGPVNRIIDRKGLFAFMTEMGSGLWNYHPREIINTTEFAGLQSYERNIRTILDFAKLDKTRVVLMSEPFFFKPGMTDEEKKVLELLNYQSVGPTKLWSIETAIAGMKAYNGKMEEIAHAENASFIDLEKTIPKTLEYFYDEVHYRVNTFDLVATGVADGLKKSGVLENVS